MRHATYEHCSRHNTSLLHSINAYTSRHKPPSLVPAQLTLHEAFCRLSFPMVPCALHHHLVQPIEGPLPSRTYQHMIKCPFLYSLQVAKLDKKSFIPHLRHSVEVISYNAERAGELPTTGHSLGAVNYV